MPPGFVPSMQVPRLDGRHEGVLERNPASYLLGKGSEEDQNAVRR